MSRYIERHPDGSRRIEISSTKECRLLVNDICCCADSDYSSETPNSEDCETCPFWVDEDCEIRSDDTRIREEEDSENDE